MTILRDVHDDHADLRPAIDALRTTADEVAVSTFEALHRSVETVRIYLHAELIPHLEAEEEILYPAVREAMGSDTATVGMEHDHGQIRALAAEVAAIDLDLASLGEMTPETAVRIRRVFYGLYALLLNHFEKEESFYWPYLQRALSPERQAGLVTALETATALRVLEATS